MAKKKPVAPAPAGDLVIGKAMVVTQPPLAPSAKATCESLMDVEYGGPNFETIATEGIKWCKAQVGVVDAHLSDLKTTTNAAVKAVRDLYNGLTKPFKEAEAHLRGLLEEAANVATLEAEAVEEEAKSASPSALAAAVYVPPVLPKAEGLTFRTSHEVEVVDFKTFVHAVAKGDVPLDALTVNDEWFTAQVKMHEGKLDLPGIVVHTKRTPVVSS
jgi:hypothetical protein